MKSVRIGGKLRRMRQERHMTQTQMAAELGLSPSYLNLIESNQRPVTVRVLLKLAERFQVELSTLAPEDDERLSSHLLEVFSDPLFDGADVKTSDVRDLVSGLPAVAHAIVDLYEAYPAPRLGARLERRRRGRERERRDGPAVGGDHRVPAAAPEPFPAARRRRRGALGGAWPCACTRCIRT